MQKLIACLTVFILTTSAYSYEDNYVSMGVGLVFTEVPISSSEFKVLMADLSYNSSLYDNGEDIRMIGSLGVYGFAIILPVPKVGMSMYYGKFQNDVKFKLGMNAFYDVTVGGHGGVAFEAGALFNDRFEVAFMTVPVGTDSKRDYLEFVGIRDEPGDKPFVVMPYFGIFLSTHF